MRAEVGSIKSRQNTTKVLYIEPLSHQHVGFYIEALMHQSVCFLHRNLSVSQTSSVLKDPKILSS